MITQDIYRKYTLPDNLQTHHLRVAALENIITDSWTGSKIDSNTIINTCLFHDIAKPVDFDPEKQERFVKDPQKLQTLKQVIIDMRQKYGTNEQEALQIIFQEIGLSKSEQRLAAQWDWHRLSEHIANQDYEAIICIYADMRVAPHGIESIDDRIDDLSQRSQVAQVTKLKTHGYTAERLIQKYTSKDIKRLSELQAIDIIEELKNKQIN